MAAGGEKDAKALLGLLGLARRAGKVAVGFQAVAQLVSRGKRPLLIVASDVSEGQKQKIMRLGPVRAVWDDRLGREELAQAMGRRELVVVALDDPDFLRGMGLDGSGRGGRPARRRTGAKDRRRGKGPVDA